MNKDILQALAIDTDVTDTIDRANHQAEFATDLALIKHFQAIEKALPRTINGHIFCLDCENPIPAERLAALPACCRCIDCQIIHEKELRL